MELMLLLEITNSQPQVGPKPSTRTTLERLRVQPRHEYTTTQTKTEQGRNYRLRNLPQCISYTYNTVYSIYYKAVFLTNF